MLWWEQVRNPDVDGLADGLCAAFMRPTFEEYLAVLADGDSQAGVMIVVCGAERVPPIRGLLDALQAGEQAIDRSHFAAPFRTAGQPSAIQLSMVWRGQRTRAPSLIGAGIRPASLRR